MGYHLTEADRDSIADSVDLDYVKNFPTKKYKTIVADPPWQYNNKKTGGSMQSGATQNYSTLTLDQICHLPVREITEKDAVLFLWCTTPLADYAFEVIDAWGFKYKTKLYWRKIMSLGMGFWFRGQVEECLVCTKGNVKAFRSQSPNIFQSKVREHSRKPEELFNLIDPIIERDGLTPKIELFARYRRDGWDCWGNEV